MKRQAVCAVCGQEFIADRVTQKYCSSYCRRYAHRHGANNHVRSSRKKEALRTFRCLKCGKLVRVTEPTDRRIKFFQPTASACTGSIPRRSAPSSSGEPSNAATAEPSQRSRSRRTSGRFSAARPAGNDGFPYTEQRKKRLMKLNIKEERAYE